MTRTCCKGCVRIPSGICGGGDVGRCGPAQRHGRLQKLQVATAPTCSKPRDGELNDTRRPVVGAEEKVLPPEPGRK